MLKILIISPYATSNSLANFYIEAFKQSGYYTSIFNIYPGASWEGGVYRYYNYLHKKNNYLRREYLKKRYAILINRIMEIEPDLIFVIQGDNLNREILLKIKHIIKTKIFIYYADNPWYSAKNNSYLWETLDIYDIVFTFSRNLIPHLYFRGAKIVKYLPFAYDPSTHFKENAPTHLVNFFTSNLAYIGTYNPHIEKWLKILSPYGLKIWGNGWNKSKPEIKKHWVAPGKELIGLGSQIRYIAAHTKIIVNFIRSEHQGGHSMKTFELPACGAFVISTRTEEQVEFFMENKSGVYFYSETELIKQVNYFLENSELREIIKQEAYNIASKHTYQSRVEKFIKQI